MHLRFLSASRRAAYLALLLTHLLACDGGRPAEASDGGRAADAPAPDADGAEDLACTGVPTACEARSIERCGFGAGCFEIGACEEVPRTCTGLTVDVCGATPGCAWFDIVGRCGLAFLDCTRGDDEDGCAQIAGCTWTPRCVGAPLACDQIADGQCLDQDGCVLTPRAGIAR
jgi:hypothetical protein